MSGDTNDRRREPGAGAVLIVAALAAVVVTALLAVDTLDTARSTSSTGGTPAPTGSPTTIDRAPTTTEPPPTTTEPTTTTTTSSPTTAPPTATSAPPTPRPGDEGPEVAALQERLADLGFFVPAADGRYGSVTAQAVMAFQKSVGLGRDGIAGPETVAALGTAAPPAAREGGDHIEIDLERQLMFVVHGGETLVLNTSTGTSGWRTPPGRFEITREIDGMRSAPLGQLWRPKYFNGGIALHGSPSIPGHPASHGCARLHHDAIDHLWAADLAPIGTPVWVY